MERHWLEARSSVSTLELIFASRLGFSVDVPPISARPFSYVRGSETGADFEFSDEERTLLVEKYSILSIAYLYEHWFALPRPALDLELLVFEHGKSSVFWVGDKMLPAAVAGISILDPDSDQINLDLYRRNIQFHHIVGDYLLNIFEKIQFTELMYRKIF